MVTQVNGDPGNVLTVTPSGAPATPARAKTANPPPIPETAAQTPDYGIRLRVDESTHEVVVMIVDPETRAVIREIPPEEMKTASAVIRALVGHLVDKRV